jgi:uncharacterized membrane protein YfcA
MLESIIFLLSVIHSIFGIGLLAIGTPLLLILNYDFLTILKILLPCSILISIFQIIKKKNILNKDKKIIYISLPYVFLGAFIIYILSEKINFKLIISCTILIILFLNFFLKKKLSALINRNKIILISLAGLIHGLTNTGGSLISLIFQGLKKNKYNVRVCIAYAYFFYALVQYSLLIIFKKKVLLDFDSAILLIFTSIGYYLGNIIFKKLKYIYFINILNFIIFLSAVYLLISELR